MFVLLLSNNLSALDRSSIRRKFRGKANFEDYSLNYSVPETTSIYLGTNRQFSPPYPAGK